MKLSRLTLVLFLLTGLTVFTFWGCGGEKKNERTEASTDAIADDNGEDFLDEESSDGEEKTLDNLEEEYLQSDDATNEVASFDGSFAEDGKYTVQISASRSEEGANQLSQKMKDEGFPAYVAVVESPTPDNVGTFYRVRIGFFNTVSSAKAFGEHIASMGYSWWVDNHSNDNVGTGASTSAPQQESWGNSDMETQPAEEPAAQPAQEEATAEQTPATDTWGSEDATPAAPTASDTTTSTTSTDTTTASTTPAAADEWGAEQTPATTETKTETAPATDDWGSSGSDEW